MGSGDSPAETVGDMGRSGIRRQYESTLQLVACLGRLAKKLETVAGHQGVEEAEN